MRGKEGSVFEHVHCLYVTLTKDDMKLILKGCKPIELEKCIAKAMVKKETAKAEKPSKEVKEEPSKELKAEELSKQQKEEVKAVNTILSAPRDLQRKNNGEMFWI